MSASSKKKFRKEQNAAKLTERQRKEQAEAKKLKATSIIFIVIMAAVVVTALTVMVITSVQNSGILEKNTVVATVGDHEINAVEANYYFSDLVTSTYSEWYSMYGDYTETYLAFMGLDLSLPLNEQYYDEGVTWADYFLESAMDQAKSDYAIYDLAVSDGYTLSEDEQSALDSSLQNLELYAMIYGYSKTDDYLEAMYGHGSTLESYQEYTQRSAVASAYYTAYNDSLTYDDAAIRAYEEDKYNDYSSFSYAYYYLSCSSFLPTDTEETTDEDTAAAEAEATAAAESLLSATSIDELDTAIATLDINADVDDAHSTQVENALFTTISSTYSDWLADSQRKENDIELFTNSSTSTDEDGNETTKISGYYVVMFLGADDNTQPMSNVRHLLVEFEGGTTDDDGNTTYSDDEKATAKAEADGYLETWLAGDKTEDSFIELVKEYSDDSSASTGGLFEDINPDSSYVANFLNWSIDDSRKAGDCEVIETEYGYHVMFYVGDDELSYRDYMISSDMRTEDLDAWYDSVVEAVTLTVLTTSRLNLDRVLSAS